MQTYYPKPVLERAMKIQEVILRAMAGKIYVNRDSYYLFRGLYGADNQLLLHPPILAMKDK